jgi:hypothetical protein
MTSKCGVTRFVTVSRDTGSRSVTERSDCVFSTRIASKPIARPTPPSNSLETSEATWWLPLSVRLPPVFPVMTSEARSLCPSGGSDRMTNAGRLGGPETLISTE